VFQEAAILIFLVVLAIFSFLKNSGVNDSNTLEALEMLVIVAVIVAVACEIIMMIYTIFDVGRNLLKKKNLDDKDKDEEIGF
jgi:hypothetical protein